MSERSFFAELKRRNVWRAAAFYAAGAWLVAQVAGLVLPAYQAEAWVLRWIISALVVGFPFWLLFAWFYEITPEGIRRESEIEPHESITAHTGKRLDRWIIAILSLAVVLLLTDRFVLRHDATGPVAVRAIPEIESDPSIAVLPMVNMSDDKANEFFSDGISEELLNLLAKVPKLRVVARTSSFSFKGKNVPIPEIARALHVASVLEGSVRKSGDKVRITAQLIRASDGSHLWSETYDRTLEDIFKVQDEIAATVVDKLKVTLLGAAPTVKPVDARAYPLILQAGALTDQGTAAADAQAEALYLKAIEIAPEEPRAWTGLGRVYLNEAIFNERPVIEGTRLAKEALHKALELDPGDALALSLLARAVGDLENDPAAAAPLYEKALSLDSTNPIVINSAGVFLWGLGRLEQATELLEYRLAHDPANPVAHGNLGQLHYYARRWEQSIASNRTALALSPTYGQARSSIAFALLLSHADLAAALVEIEAETDELARMQGMPIVLHALGRKAEADAALGDLITRHGHDGALFVATAYAFLGEADSAFEWLEKAVVNRDANLLYLPLEPLFDKLHDDPRWLTLLRKLGKAPEQLARIELKVTLPDRAVAGAAQ